MRYTEGIQGNTVLILKDGLAMHISDILQELNKSEHFRGTLVKIAKNSSSCQCNFGPQHFGNCTLSQAKNALKE